MRRFLPLLASLVLLALPSAAQAYTFYEWDAVGAPTGIAAGTNGLTVTFNSSGEVGGVTLNGVQSARSAIVGPSTKPGALAAGPGDGNFWWVDPTNNKAGRTDAGVGPVTLSSAVIDNRPTDLVAAANNLMWIVEPDSGDIDCVTPAGVAVAKNSGLTHPTAIARGNDGTIWVIDTGANLISRFAQPANCSATAPPPSPIFRPTRIRSTSLPRRLRATT